MTDKRDDELTADDRHSPTSEHEMPERPAKSPTPNYEERGQPVAARTITREMPVTKGALLDANRFTRLLVVFFGVGGGFGGGWMGLQVMRAEAQTVADAGVVRAREVAEATAKVQEQRISMLEKGQLSQADDVRETKEQVRDVKKQVSDVSLKMDALLEKMRVVNPAPADGGR